ncbi:MAG: hypothetical protein RL732_1331 [Bacteroidota bacterium]|jgi:hypothetical protein
MQAALAQILKNYFQKDSLESVSEAELVEFCRKYPFATIGHLLLAKKKKWWGDDYQKEAEKTALYLNNPLWLHYLLQMETDKAGTIQKPEEAAPLETTSVTEPAATESEAPPTPVTVTDKTETKEPLKATPEPSLIDPYHTVDYFASQGIKLRTEELDKDAFGRQLRSFTDWLRSMKRIQPTGNNNSPETTVDESIERTAAYSISTSDVETEAMAEVWLKQGNKEKALEIYRKLSLHNPSKSHYFAAKIDQLNAK